MNKCLVWTSVIRLLLVHINILNLFWHFPISFEFSVLVILFSFCANKCQMRGKISISE